MGRPIIKETVNSSWRSRMPEKNPEDGGEEGEGGESAD